MYQSSHLPIHTKEIAPHSLPTPKCLVYVNRMTLRVTENEGAHALETFCKSDAIVTCTLQWIRVSILPILEGTCREASARLYVILLCQRQVDSKAHGGASTHSLVMTKTLNLKQNYVDSLENIFHDWNVFQEELQSTYLIKI